MAQGLLEVSGKIELSQFWPAGTSDADTTKIKVSVEAGGIRFRPRPGAPSAVTTVLDDATVTGGNGRFQVLKNGNLTVRLQGVDAPELHYRPSAEKKKAQQTAEQHTLYLKWNLEYRQQLGETATVALAQFLGGLGADPLPCKVRTMVDTPGEVFDVYGRMVGDIFVKVPGGEEDVNLWLAKQGWAMPTFYTSMSEDEISAITDAANAAYAAGSGVWDLYSDSVAASDFDTDLEFRGKGAALNAVADQGPVIMPKLFRRMAAYVVNRKSKMVNGSFESYLRSKRTSDAVHLVDEFLAQGASAAPLRYLDEFVTAEQCSVWPEELVFREKGSKLTGPGGAVIAQF